MRSKTYRASTMKEAMTRVRRDLGGDAVILSAREVRRRRLFGLGPRAVVEVTASDTMPAERGRQAGRRGCVAAKVITLAAAARDFTLRRACRHSSAKSSAGCTRWSRT